MISNPSLITTRRRTEKWEHSLSDIIHRPDDDVDPGCRGHRSTISMNGSLFASLAAMMLSKFLLNLATLFSQRLTSAKALLYSVPAPIKLLVAAPMRTCHCHFEASFSSWDPWSSYCTRCIRLKGILVVGLLFRGLTFFLGSTKFLDCTRCIRLKGILVVSPFPFIFFLGSMEFHDLLRTPSSPKWTLGMA